MCLLDVVFLLRSKAGGMSLSRYPELIPAASFLLVRLQRLVPSNSTYYGLQLRESLIESGTGGLCIKEAHTLYQVC
jgi:hypothetical protein